MKVRGVSGEGQLKISKSDSSRSETEMTGERGGLMGMSGLAGSAEAWRVAQA